MGKMQALGVIVYPTVADRRPQTRFLRTALPRFIVGLALGGVLAVDLRAQTPPAGEASLQALADGLRPFLIEAVPSPLFEKSYNWGKQSMSFHGIKWRGLEPRVVKAPRNDGTWRKVKVTAWNLPHFLTLKAYDLQQVDAERQTFKVYLSFRAIVDYEQQNWESGVRLYSGSVKANLRLHALLECENHMRFENGKSLLPDVVMRMRVVKATVKYDDLNVDHIAGLGGSAARVLGDAVHDVVKTIRPSLEESMLARANAAIVKAADTREVRISLGKLTSSRPKSPAPKK
jgi:hypothetical protein